MQCIYSAQCIVLLCADFIIINEEVLNMAFQIKPDKKESENKTIRFPVELIKRIEKAIEKKDVTFTGFVIQACEYALSEMID